MDRLCYTCQAIVPDERAIACPREYCAARSDIQRETKPQGTRPPQLNPGEHPTYYDDGGGA